MNGGSVAASAVLNYKRAQIYGLSVLSGRSAAWLARLVRDQEVEGSNPFAPTTFSLIFIGLFIMPLLPPKFVAQITILEARDRVQLFLLCSWDATILTSPLQCVCDGFQTTTVIIEVDSCNGVVF